MGRKSLEKTIDKESKKRGLLAEAAFPYFQDMGIKEFKMDQLAKLLGKSKTTIYKYFVGREDLVGFIVRNKIEQLKEFDQYLLNKDLEYLKRYELSILHIGKVLRGISNKFLLEISEVYPELWREIQTFRINASKLLEGYYNEGLESGQLKNIHPSILIMTDKLFFESLLSQNFLKTSNLTVEDALQNYFELKCFGMAK